MITDTLKFWTYLILFILSVLCSLFVLYHFLFNRNLRRALNNHVVILILFVGLICEILIYPWMFYFYQYQGVWERSLIFCELWSYIDWTCYVIQTMLFAWAAVERHILIFHDKWILTEKKRFFIHYLPLIFIPLYCLILYIYVYFFPSCENFFDNSYPLCAIACLSFTNIFYQWEMIVHQVVPAVITIVFSIALLVRVLWQKHRVHLPIRWRKHRKMTIQLLSISILYILFFFPYTVYLLLLHSDVVHESFAEFAELFYYFAYYTMLLLPFVCLISLRELRTILMKFLHLQRPPRRIAVRI